MSEAPDLRLNAFLTDIERTPETPPLGPELIRLDRNEHVGPLPQRVVDAILARVRPALFSDYPNPWHFYEKLAARVGLPMDLLLLVAGSDAALRSICHVLIGRGDRVAMIEPSYAMYSVYTRMFGGEPVFIPIRADLTVDVDRALDACGASRLLFLANPNQPTATLLDGDALTAVIRRAAGTGTVVVVDEAYFPFSRFSVIDAVRAHPHLLVIRTFSKAYGLAGLRIGFVAGPSALIRALYKVRSAYDVNAFAVLCADYLLDHHEVVDDFVRHVWQSAAALQALARRYGLEAPATATNFQLIKTAPRFDPRTVSERLRQRGWMIRGPVGDGVMADYIRVTLGEVGLLDRFGAALAEVLEELGAGEPGAAAAAGTRTGGVDGR